MWHHCHGLVDKVVLGHRLVLMISTVFSNLVNSSASASVTGPCNNANHSYSLEWTEYSSCFKKVLASALRRSAVAFKPSRVYSLSTALKLVDHSFVQVYIVFCLHILQYSELQLLVKSWRITRVCLKSLSFFLSPQATKSYRIYQNQKSQELS